jgi:hypothetical protein
LPSGYDVRLAVGSQIIELLLFDERQDVVAPAASLLLTSATIWISIPGPAPATGWQVFVYGLVVQKSQADLFEVIFTFGSPGSLSGGLHGGQQQGHQDSDDGNHDKQLDEGETFRRYTTCKYGSAISGFYAYGPVLILPCCRCLVFDNGSCQKIRTA